MHLPLVYLFERARLPVPADLQEEADARLFAEGIRLKGEAEKKAGVLYLQNTENGAEYDFRDPAGATAVSGCVPGKKAADILNACLDVLDSFQKISEKTDILRAENAVLQSYIPLFSELMGNPVYIVDASYKVIAIDTDPVYPEMSAIWRFLVTNRYLSYDIIKELQESREMQDMTRRTGARVIRSAVFPTSFINAPLFQDQQLLGHVFVVGYNSALTPGRVALAEQIRRLVQDLLQNAPRFYAAEIRGYENFFIHLLTGTLTDPSVIRRQCRSLQINETGSYLMVVMPAGGGDFIRNEGICRKISRQMGGYPLIYEDSIVFLFEAGSTEIRESLLRALRRFARSEHFNVGVSDVFSEISEMGRYYLQAKQASVLSEKASGSKVTAYDEIAVSQLLSVRKGELPDYFIDPMIRQLAQYDAVHHTEYLRTLRVYLERERNITVTAAELAVHRNTLLYRIERMQKMYQRNLDDAPVRLRLLLSIYLLQQDGSGE